MIFSNQYLVAPGVEVSTLKIAKTVRTAVNAVSGRKNCGFQRSIR